MQLDNVQKIAVLRANAIGDFIFAVPALQVLRQTYRKAEITLLALDWHATFTVPLQMTYEAAQSQSLP